MKILFQRGRGSWQEIDSSAWPPPGGSIFAVNVQGCQYDNYENYHIADQPDGSVVVTCWELTDRQRALEATFRPLAPDPRFGNAVNTDQSFIHYVAPALYDKLTARPIPANTEFRRWSAFAAPVGNIAPGDPVNDPERETRRNARSTKGWREWGNSRVPIQRDLGRWARAKGTVTYYQRNITRNGHHVAVGIGNINEDAFELATATAATIVQAGVKESNFTFIHTTPSGEPNVADWPNGSYRVQYDVTAVTESPSYGLLSQTDGKDETVPGHFARVDSGLTADQETWVQAESAFTGTGLKLATATRDPSAGAAGDRYETRLGAIDTGGEDWDITFEVNTADSFADGPWVSGAPVSQTMIANWEALETLEPTIVGSHESIAEATDSMVGSWEALKEVPLQSIIAKWEALEGVPQTVVGHHEAQGFLAPTLIGNWEAEAEVDQTILANWEATSALLQTVLGNHEALAEAVQTVVAHHEARGFVAPTFVGNWESGADLLQAYTGTWESLAELLQTVLSNWEAAADFLQTVVGHWESEADLTTTVVGHHEALGGIESTVIGHHGALAELVVTLVGNWEALAELLQTVVANWEAEGLAAVSQTFIGHWESLASLLQTVIGNWESQESPIATVLANWEARGFLAPTMLAHHEALAAVLGPVATRFWNERFEASPGFDETWSLGETIGTGPTMDEDATPPSAADASWGKESYEIATAGGQDSILSHDFPTPIPISYARFEFVLTAETLLNTEITQIWEQRTAGGAATLVRGSIVKDGVGALMFRSDIFHDGSSNIFDVSISLDTLYRVEYKWDTENDLWEWWFDGVSQNSGSLTGSAATAELTRISLGPIDATSHSTMTVFFDQVALDEVAMVGADVLSSPTVIGHHEALAELAVTVIGNWESIADLLQTLIGNWEAEAEVNQTVIGNWEALAELLQNVVANWEALGFQAVSQTFIGHWESLADILQTAIAHHESQASPIKIAIANWEARGFTAQNVVANWEARGFLSQTAIPNWEALGEIDQTVLGHWESLTEAVQTVTGHHEAIAELLQTVVGHHEAVAELLQTVVGNWEAEGFTAVSQNVIGNWEALASLTQTVVGIHEARGFLAANVVGSHEAEGLLSKTIVANWESLAELSQTLIGNHEALGAIIQTVIAHHEARGFLAKNLVGSHESLAAPSTTFTGDYEAVASLLQTVVANHEALGGVLSAVIGNWETLIFVSPLTFVSIEDVAMGVPGLVTVTMLSPTLTVVTITVPKLTGVILTPD